YMRANWLCGRFCVQASSFENYIAEKPFTDRFVQQSPSPLFCYANNTIMIKGNIVEDTCSTKSNEIECNAVIRSLS
ncbi:hypothetical protein ACLDXX_18015, partial [Acinetobacter baumannii]